jgi:hypothetical protein
MHRSYPNVVPVSNKYLGHKSFLKAQADHENNVNRFLYNIIKIDFFVRLKMHRVSLINHNLRLVLTANNALDKNRFHYSIDFLLFYLFVIGKRT